MDEDDILADEWAEEHDGDPLYDEIYDITMEQMFDDGELDYLFTVNPCS